MMEELSHVNSKGEARMVDISPKGDTLREAIAIGGTRMKPATLQKIKQNEFKKGDVLAVARVAGIMAGKKTHELIPLCHPIIIDNITGLSAYSPHMRTGYAPRISLCLDRTTQRS